MTTISEFMSADHDRLDALMAQVRVADDPVERSRSFTEFAAGLLTHIEWEEDILFPAFEERTGTSEGGPTAVMRLEHERIKQLLGVGEERQEQTGGADFAQIALELVGVLAMHNRKEELILYPWMDRELTADETAGALRRMSSSHLGTRLDITNSGDVLDVLDNHS